MSSKRGGSSGYTRSRGESTGGSNNASSNITPFQRTQYERAERVINNLGKTRIDRGFTVDAGGDVGKITLKGGEEWNDGWEYAVSVTSKNGTRKFSESNQEDTRRKAQLYARSLIPTSAWYE